jgi:hypothetical protein
MFSKSLYFCGETAMFDALSSLNSALRGASDFNPFGARPKKADATLELARPPARRDAQGFGEDIFRAAKRAATEALKGFDDLGAASDTLARMADELQSRVAADAAKQAFAPPRVPMAYGAGERVSLSIEIESLSISISEDGQNFSMRYTRVSISMVSERYVAGKGASPKELEAFFADDGGERDVLALLKPFEDAQEADAQEDDATEDPWRRLLDVFVPLEKRGRETYGFSA